MRTQLQILLIGLFLSSCTDVEKVGKDSGSGEIQYPISRLITDSSGRELQVTILGRSSDQITIERQSDGTRFDLPIEKLSDVDKAYVKQLPAKAAPAPKVAQTAIEQTAPEPLYIRNRRDAIQKLNNRIDIVKAEIKAGVKTPTLKMSRKQEVKDLEQEIKEIELDIATYKRNNRLD